MVDIEKYNKKDNLIEQDFGGIKKVFTFNEIMFKRNNLQKALDFIKNEEENINIKNLPSGTNKEQHLKHLESCEKEVEDRIKAIDDILEA